MIISERVWKNPHKIRSPVAMVYSSYLYINLRKKNLFYCLPKKKKKESKQVKESKASNVVATAPYPGQQAVTFSNVTFNYNET